MALAQQRSRADSASGRGVLVMNTKLRLGMVGVAAALTFIRWRCFDGGTSTCQCRRKRVRR